MARILDIDHAMLNVADAGAAGDLWQGLGFSVTPLSAMPGLANRLICFPPTDAAEGICNYIELMALTDAAAAPPPMPDLLGQRQGPVSTVMAVDDARAVAARLAGQGFQSGHVLDLQRDWQLPDGRVISPAFSVTIPALGQSPFFWNLCQHKTPQHYGLPAFTAHANGIVRLDAVLAVDPDPLAAGRVQASLWQVEAAAGPPVTLAPGRVVFEIWTPDAFQACFELAPLPGLTALRLISADIERTAAAIPAARRAERGLIVDAGRTAGTILEIVAEE